MEEFYDRLNPDEFYEDDFYDADLEEINISDDPNYFGVLSDDFAADVRDLLEELIAKAEEGEVHVNVGTSKNGLKENFLSMDYARKHLSKHCLGKKINYRKCISNVRYDFSKLSEYVVHERYISDKCLTADFVIDSLYNTADVIRGFYKLSQGNFTLRFSLGCELANDNGLVELFIHSFANDATTNYTEGNTVDLCVKTKRFTTLSLYPVTLAFIFRKFKNIVRMYAHDPRVEEIIEKL